MSSSSLFAGARDSGRRLLVGVVHLLPTPGAPRHEGAFARVLERARSDASALVRGGCDALIVENFGDVPFHAHSVPPETIAAIALAVEAVRGVAAHLPVGVNVLRNDARAALGICAATGARFLRVNVHVGAAVTDQGLVQGEAAATLRERARLCPDVLILADVHVKHATPLGATTLERATEETVLRGLADAVIVSGHSTGSEPRAEDVASVCRASAGAPVLLGSGVTAENAGKLLTHAAGAVVGTWLKENGRVSAPVDPTRVAELRAAFDALSSAAD